ncbi:hypothetical protein [Pseudaquabacterium rugosum]|uniref:UrcA family protein n=1 Tax=Pseudaquabacterium rugosum TaxID=2984194 RepID=A0ABU9B591_9BURK
MSPRKSLMRERIEGITGALLMAAAIALPVALIDPITTTTEEAPMRAELTMAARGLDAEDASRWPAMAAEACTEIGADMAEQAGAPRSWVVTTCGVAAAAVVAALAWLARGA